MVPFDKKTIHESVKLVAELFHAMLNPTLESEVIPVLKSYPTPQEKDDCP